jgi:hypothetical protein
MQGPNREFRVLGCDQNTHFDLRSGDNLNIYTLARQGLEHLERHASMAAHADTDDRDLGDIGVGLHLGKLQIGLGALQPLDGAGEIGVISSVTQAFCSTCTRARLSTDGRLYTCLFAQRGYDLKGMLRSGADDEAIARGIAAVWQRRSDRYSEIRTEETARRRKVEMSFIGG